jgi:hypothetical protein
VSVFNKRNALIGFVTVKAASRWLERRRKPRRSGLRIAGFVALGLVSLGIAAAVAAALRRRADGESEVADVEVEDDVVGEHVTLPAEPIPAT